MIAEVTLFSAIALGAIAGGAHIANATTSADSPTYKGLVPDPNLPLNGLETDKISVAYSGGSPTPMIRLKGHMNRNNQAASYLGYNDEGSWLANPSDGKIYVYNLSKNSITLKYNISTDIPKTVMASLRDPAKEQQLAQDRANPQPTEQARPAPAPKPDGGRALVGDQSAGLSALLGQAMQNRQNQQASGGLSGGAGFTGSGARIQGGVLTFTLQDGKTASYKVVRPKSGSNPQPTAGNAGTWVSLESNGNGIMFTVQEGGAVSGKEFPAAVMQMLL
jgi:hypothetical protein